MRLLTKTAAAVALFAGLGLMAAPEAQAVPQTVSYNLVFSQGQDPVPGLTATDYLFTTDFQRWNPLAFPGATLTGIYIEVTGNAGGTVNFYDSTCPGTCTGGGTLIGGGVNPTKAGVQISVATPDSSVIVPLPTTTLGSSQVIPAGAVANGAGSFTLNLTGATNTQSHNVLLADFGLFTGTGFATTTGGVCGLAPSANSACSFVVTNSTGNVASLPAITASESGFIRYTYDDGVQLSPEPASMALFGVGLLGLGALRRRVRR